MILTLIITKRIYIFVCVCDLRKQYLMEYIAIILLVNTLIIVNYNILIEEITLTNNDR